MDIAVVAFQREGHGQSAVKRPVPVRVIITSEQLCDGSHQVVVGGQSSDQVTEVGRTVPADHSTNGQVFLKTPRANCVMSHTQGVERPVPSCQPVPDQPLPILTNLWNSSFFLAFSF